MIRTFYLLFCLLCLAVGAATDSNAESVSVTDSLQRRVKTPVPVKRIVAIGPGCLRLVCYMQAQGLLAGVEEIERRRAIGIAPYNLANAGFRNLPSVGPGGPNASPDHEKIMSLKPDVIFLTYAADRSQADGLQEKTGIPVVVLSYGINASFEKETLYRSLNIMGMVLGREMRANAIIQFMESAYKELNARTADIPQTERPCIYVGGISMRGNHGIESTQAYFPPLMAINARNPVNELVKKGMPVTVDKEKLLLWNPDILIIDMGGLDLVLADYEKNTGFYNLLKAVRERRVYMELPYNSYATNVENALIDAYWLAKLAYPDRFQYLDIEEKAGEIYRFFLGCGLVEEMKKAGYWFREVKLHD
ncbi:MAG: iron ABC transporter substrate-binding protein [Dissulfuribacterales bacterium]